VGEAKAGIRTLLVGERRENGNANSDANGLGILSASSARRIAYFSKFNSSE